MGRWFSPGTPVSSTNKTDRYNWNSVGSGVKHHNTNHHPHLHTYPFLLTLITVSFSKLGYVFLWTLSICVEYLVEIIPMTMISSYLFHRLFVLINIESASSLCLSCLVFPLRFSSYPNHHYNCLDEQHEGRH
jgi:hypothetical protein